MATLASILADPNYVNANEPTKRAIFDKFSAEDPNFVNANPATQDAIRQRFGVSTAPAAPELPMALQPSARMESGVPGPRQDLTTGQRIYQAARPYVAPLVEAGGAIAGGLVGTAAGVPTSPVGMATLGVAGAGLGYGMAKEGLEMADVAMGMKPPRQGAAQIVEPVRNVVEGGLYETVGRVAGPALSYVGGKIADLRQIPVQKAANIAKNALGEDLPQAINMLRAAQGKDVSAAQATANLNNPTFQALIDRATARDPRFTRAFALLQEKGSINALADLAGGATAAAARGTVEQAKTNLNQITGPMRETALKRADLGKYVADEAAARNANDIAMRMGSGSVIEPAEFIAQAAGAEKALRSVGIKPLEGGPLADKIANISKNPSFAANDLIEGSVNQAANAIRQWTSSKGVIDADALEAIRKNAVTAAIAKLRPGADATAQRNLAAGVLSKIKPVIDDAIEAAGGTGWRDYLNTHAKGMNAINEKKLAGKALDLFKNNKDEFVRLVQNESPEVVEKILGPGKYNIATELADNTMAVLQEQAKKRLTDIAVKEQVTAGQDALKQLLLDNMSKLRVPSYLNAVAATTNKALQILETKIGAKTMTTLTEALKTPQGAADLLATLPGEERVKVLKLLSDPSQWKSGTKAVATGTTTMGVNALAPDRYDNALANQPARIILNNMAPGRP